MTDIGTLKGISERVREKFTSAYAAWVHSEYGYGTAESRDEIAAIVVWGGAVVARDTGYIAALEARIAELEAAQVTQENEEVGPKLTPDKTLILTVLFMHGPMNEQEFKPFIEKVSARTFFSLWEAEAGFIVFNEGRFSITAAGRRALGK